MQACGMDKGGMGVRAALMRFLSAAGLALLCSVAAAQGTPPPPSSIPPPAGPQKARACDDTGDVLSRVLCTKTLRVGVRTGYPPFAYEDNNVLQGFEIDLARHLAASLGVAPEFVVVTPANRLACWARGA
jgi:polar amino acid transport system substrate-binding protein